MYAALTGGRIQVHKLIRKGANEMQKLSQITGNIIAVLLIVIGITALAAIIWHAWLFLF